MSSKVHSSPKAMKRKIKAEKLSPAKKIKCEVESDEDEFTAPLPKATIKKERKKRVTVNEKRPLIAPSSSSKEIEVIWLDHELLAEVEEIDLNISQNIHQLFEAGNTIPFICRYRQDMIGGMGPEQLRNCQETYQQIKLINAKKDSLLKTIEKEGVTDSQIKQGIKAAKSLDELEVLAAPFKKAAQSSLATRAKKAGLEEPGNTLLNGSKMVHISSLVSSKNPGCSNREEVCTGLQHVIADIIAKDNEVLSYIQELKQTEHILIECSPKKVNGEVVKGGKFETYFNFRQSIRTIKEHQVLAIDRAQNQKILTVKVQIPDSFWEKVKACCRRKYLSRGVEYEERRVIFEKAVEDSIRRLLSPLVQRQIRSKLTQTAKRSALAVFATNLKNLLLTPPLRGKVVLGIDPGFKNGCKLAVVSPNGEPLEVDKIFLMSSQDRSRSADFLTRCLRTHSCETIALGNGHNCRDVERFLSDLIKSGQFAPLDVSYTFISEQGASIFSCSKAAAEEFPNMDPTLISAVSIARRLQDPLAELVKVDPKNLGVGMYQHDVPEDKLRETLEEVVTECVSFVGVDVNTASEALLRNVAGLSKARAAKILAWRLKNGPFLNREQIKEVKGIGVKTFEQLAGFVRILPSTAIVPGGLSSKKYKLNPLDRTEIHPDDYKLAERLIADFKLSKEEIGSDEFCSQVNKQLRTTSITTLATKYSVSEAKMTQVSEALAKPADHDLRNLSDQPLFQRGLTSMESLKVGDVLHGVVRNVVHFGAFVDVGVGESGLVHASILGHDKSKWVKLGDRVNVRVLNVDIQKKRLGLQLIRNGMKL